MIGGAVLDDEYAKEDWCGWIFKDTYEAVKLAKGSLRSD